MSPVANNFAWAARKAAAVADASPSFGNQLQSLVGQLQPADAALAAKPGSPHAGGMDAAAKTLHRLGQAGGGAPLASLLAQLQAG